MLDELSRNTAAVLGAIAARIELGRPHPAPAGESPLPLAVDRREIGTVYLDDRAAPSLTARASVPARAGVAAGGRVRPRAAHRAGRAGRHAAPQRRRQDRGSARRQPRPADTADRDQDGGRRPRNPAYQLSDGDRGRCWTRSRSRPNGSPGWCRTCSTSPACRRGGRTGGASCGRPRRWSPRPRGARPRRRPRRRPTCPADLPPVRVDPTHAQRVLVNLLENALRYSDRDEPVLVRGTSTRREVDLASGRPWPGHRRPTSWSGSSSRSIADGQAHSGAGLGLAIARGFAEANGGQVWAESQPGQGRRRSPSRFRWDDRAHPRAGGRRRAADPARAGHHSARRGVRGRPGGHRRPGAGTRGHPQPGR